MQKEDVLIGGEESGGIGFKNYVPERDGVLCGLLLIELLAIKKKTLGEMIDYLDNTFGTYRYRRVDQHFPNEKKEKLLTSLKENPPSEVLGKKVKESKTYDGVKLIMEDNSWLLFRASGTEPLLRIYAETNSEQEVETYIQNALKIAEEQSQ
jgi:phosphomannomutase